MKRKQAKALDSILNKFTSNCYLTSVNEIELPLCNVLEGLGYIEVNDRSESPYPILLTDKGNEFKAKGGFIEQYRKDHLQATFVFAIIAAIAAITSVLLQTYQLFAN